MLNGNTKFTGITSKIGGGKEREANGALPGNPPWVLDIETPVMRQKPESTNSYLGNRQPNIKADQRREKEFQATKTKTRGIHQRRNTSTKIILVTKKHFSR